MAGLPTTQPFGKQPFTTPASEGELRRNVLWDLGDTTTGASPGEYGWLKALDLNLFNSLATANQSISLGQTNCIAAPFSRYMINNAAQANQNAILQLVGVWLPQNLVVSNFNFMAGTTGDASPTNQWMCLLNSARVSVAVSADATSTAITASTTTAPVTVTYPVATVAAGAATTYVVPSSGLYYIGLAVNGSSTLLTTGYSGLLEAVNATPKLAGNSTTSTTTPIAVGGSAQTAITGVAAVPYMWLS